MVQKWMRNRFFFFLGSDGGTKGVRRHQNEEVKQIWQRKDRDGQRNPVLAPDQHTSSFSGCEERCCSRRAHYEMTLTQPDLLRRIIRRKSALCIPPPRPHLLQSILFPFPEILSPPVWQLRKLHVHLTQKDPANVPLARFNRSHFLGSLAALIYLEDRLLIQRDWDARRGGKAPLCEFWIPRRHLSTAEDELPLLSMQREKKERKIRKGDIMIGRLAARVHGSHIEDCTSTTTITQTACSQGNHLVPV